MAGSISSETGSARKRALILESELNRLLIQAEFVDLRSSGAWRPDFIRLAGQAKHVAALAGPLASLLSRRSGKKSRKAWTHRVQDGLKLAAPLTYVWRQFRRRSSSTVPAVK